MGTGFIIFAMGTIVLSFAAELTNELRLFKDIADAGYIRDSKKLDELKKQINPNGTKITFASLLLPIYNIFVVVKNINNYNIVRPQILSILKTSGLLEEMTEEERREYAKNPTGFHAFVMEVAREIEQEEPIYNKVVVIEYADEFGRNKITYDIGRNLNNLTVVDVLGPLENTWQSDKRKEIENKLKQSLLKGIKRKGTLEKYINSLNNKNGKKPIELLTSGRIYDAYDYFRENTRKEQEKQGLKENIIALNQQLDEMLFNVLNDVDDKKAIRKSITYSTDKAVWDVSIRKVSGTLKRVMYNRQFKLIFPLIRGTIAKVIANTEKKLEVLDDKTECSFVYDFDDASKCSVEVIIRYNALETKKMQDEIKRKRRAEYQKHLATIEREKYTYGLYYEETCKDGKTNFQPKLVRKPKVR